MDEKNEVLFRRISYKELKEKSYDLEGDNYGIVSEYLTESVREALLSNPNQTDDSKSVLDLIVCNGEIAGRRMLLPTRIRIDNQIVIAQSGGGLEVDKTFRGRGFGRALTEDIAYNREYPFHHGQLFSTGGIATWKKLNVGIFEKPLYVKLCKSQGGKMTHDISNVERYRKLKQKFTIKREAIIPEWVDTITLDDGHMYTEIHDHKWLQWNLDHHFTTHKYDKNFFYSVYDKKGVPFGFFMTKERFEENKDGVIKNIIRGTVVEWGSKDESTLTEVDLNLMALFSFSDYVDKINTVISTNGIEEEIKEIGFEYRGIFKMLISPDDTSMRSGDIMNQDNWRIRYGGADSILVTQ